MAMNSSRPYLIRALYEWIVDNSLTPYMLVDTGNTEVVVPLDFVEDGRIILNVSPDATHSLVLGNDTITFNARFSGTATDVNVPVGSVRAIYARENGQGMMFESDDSPSDPGPGKGASDSTAPTPISGRPRLTVVK